MYKRQVWSRVLDDDLVLMARNGNVRLRFDLSAPLNLPKYLGSADNTFKSIDMVPNDFDEQGNVVGPYTALQKRLYETSQWNTFMAMVDYREGENGLTYKTTEDKSAGVYVDAPEGYGYIGSYVWLDNNWDTYQNDTKGEVVTDTLGKDVYKRQVLYLKPVKDSDSENSYGVSGFNNQSPEYFQWVDEMCIRDSPRGGRLLRRRCSR